MRRTVFGRSMWPWWINETLTSVMMSSSALHEAASTGPSRLDGEVTAKRLLILINTSEFPERVLKSSVFVNGGLEEQIADGLKHCRIFCSWYQCDTPSSVCLQTPQLLWSDARFRQTQHDRKTLYFRVMGGCCSSPPTRLSGSGNLEWEIKAGS